MQGGRVLISEQRPRAEALVPLLHVSDFRALPKEAHREPRLVACARQSPQASCRPPQEAVPSGGTQTAAYNNNYNTKGNRVEKEYYWRWW